MDQIKKLLWDCQIRMICNKHEATDRLVTREGFRIHAILLPGILESRDDKGKVPLYKPFHELASVRVIHSQSKEVILQVALDERPKIGTRNKIDIQHHHKVRACVQASQISPSVELPRSFRRLERGENKMDVDVG